MSTITATPGAKMMYLIKRKSGTSREELVAHWFANHMPIIIATQGRQQSLDKQHATRYIATLFDADRKGTHHWDGVAQMWWPEALPRPKIPHGQEPRDTFQEKAEPYDSWATTEYVVMDGSEHLPVTPLALNEPFPTTRSGFFKVTFLVAVKPDTDYAAFFGHWLGPHVSNVRNVMEQVGGFHYAVSHSIQPEQETYAGMAEVYFHDASAWKQYTQTIKPDGMEQWVSNEGTLVLSAQTEMIGIP